LHPWGLAVAGDELELHATEARLGEIHELLKPPPELVTATLDQANYVERFTAALYEEA
jgi:acyl-CoA oxidase